MPGSTRLPRWLIGFGGFLLVGLLGTVVFSLRRPTPPVFPLTDPGPTQVGDTLVSGRVTLDGRSADRWAFFDFSRNAPVRNPGSLEWDIGVRRTSWIVNGGDGFAGRGGALASDAPFGDLNRAPDGDYTTTNIAVGDSVNRAFDRWYRYDYLSHLLWPKPTSFVVRTADGRYAKLRIESYYCAGPEPGCVTFRYTYQGNGSRELGAPAEADR